MSLCELIDVVFCIQIVVQKESHRGVHFRRAGPREKACKVFQIIFRYHCVLEWVWCEHFLYLILGLFHFGRSACLYCDMWGFMPGNQYSVT